MHTRGWKTSEHCLTWAFLIIAAGLLWKHGAAVADAVKGLAYPVLSYSFSRSWVKRRLPIVPPASPEPDIETLAERVIEHVRKTRKPEAKGQA